MPIDSPLSPLVALPDSVLWTSRTWTELAQVPAPTRHVVVLPLFGLADWGLGRPLDLEETLGTAVLREAIAQPAAKKLPLLVLPPLRWVLGPYAHSVFGLDYETALALLQEIAASVHAAGFRKLVFFNTSPWNEEMADAGGRDVRVALGLQTFCVNLSALDLDLHPVRAVTRTGIQAAASTCYGSLPTDEPVHAEITWSDFRPGNIRQPGAVPFERSLEDACRDGKKILVMAGRALAGLFGEIHARRPLVADGRIRIPRAPQAKTAPAKRRRNRSRK